MVCYYVNNSRGIDFKRFVLVSQLMSFYEQWSEKYEEVSLFFSFLFSLF